MKHGLTQEELSDLASMVKKGRSAWLWVYAPDGEKVLSPVVQVSDGDISSVTARSDHPDEVVVRSVYETLCKRRTKRRNGAKKAAATRARRRALKANQIAKRLAFGGHTGPAKNCILCGRGLNDAESIKRGIGSECWQGVVELAAAMSKQFGTEKLTGGKIDIR